MQCSKISTLILQQITNWETVEFKCQLYSPYLFNTRSERADIIAKLKYQFYSTNANISRFPNRTTDTLDYWPLINLQRHAISLRLILIFRAKVHGVFDRESNSFT